MKILIVGLGNPGEKYMNNRHNVGFMFVEYLSDKITTDYQLPTIDFTFDKYTNAEIAKMNVQTRNGKLETILAKPQTFMNRSGEAGNKLLKNEIGQQAGEMNNIYIAHDDLDLKLGEFKISKGKGPKMHNGIASVEEHLKTNEFVRIRIGIDNRDPEHRVPGEGYVLSNFSHEERMVLQDTFPLIYKQLSTQLTALR